MQEYGRFLIGAGGIYSLLLSVFHCCFWRWPMLDWKGDLPKLSPINRAVMQMLNVAVIVFLFWLGFVGLAYGTELQQSSLGRSVLMVGAVFWAARLGGEFLLKKDLKPSVGLAIILTAGIFLYLIPAVF